MMDRLDAITLFAAAVDEGSLAAAARRHSRSPAAVTRAVALLERQAHATLLLRSTRKLSLTPDGERHLAVWRDVLRKLREVEYSSPDAGLRGSIVVTTPELFGRLKVAPLVESFLRNHPQVGARVLMVNRVVDLVGEGVDLAVRIAPLPDSTLKAVRIGQVSTLFCASPEYLAMKGMPNGLSDLDDHECIGLNVEGDAELWSLRETAEDGSRTRSVRVRTRLSLNNTATAIDASLRGQGIVRAQSYQVIEHLAEGRLVRLLEKYEPSSVPAHVVFQPQQARVGLLRAFIDHAVPVLKQELADIEAAVS